MSTGPQCSYDAAAARRLEKRGIAWIAGAFLICPCHLPLSLWLIGVLVSGTAIAPFVLGHSVLVVSSILVAWLGVTTYGVHLLRAARRLREHHQVRSASPAAVSDVVAERSDP